MKEFTILVREVWIQVKADTLREAIHKVENEEGENVESGFEFSHSLEPEFWTAEDSEGRSYNDLTEITDQETR